MTHWDQEGQGFPGPRFGSPKDVPPAQSLGQGEALDGRQLHELGLFQALLGVLGQRQLRKLAGLGVANFVLRGAHLSRLRGCPLQI